MKRPASLRRWRRPTQRSHLVAPHPPFVPRLSPQAGSQLTTPERWTAAVELVLGLLGLGRHGRRARPRGWRAWRCRAGHRLGRRRRGRGLGAKDGRQSGLPFLIIDKGSARRSWPSTSMAGSWGPRPPCSACSRRRLVARHRPASAVRHHAGVTDHPGGAVRRRRSAGTSAARACLRIDYDAALSLHPVITTWPADRRSGAPGQSRARRQSHLLRLRERAGQVRRRGRATHVQGHRWASPISRRSPAPLRRCFSRLQGWPHRSPAWRPANKSSRLKRSRTHQGRSLSPHLKANDASSRGGFRPALTENRRSAHHGRRLEANLSRVRQAC